MDADHLKALRSAAVRLHGSDEIEVDELTEADVSEADEHTWVRAWVLVPNSEVSREN